MDSELISQSILRSIEERRRKRKAGQDPREARQDSCGAISSKEVATSCLSELEKSIRDSILTTFGHWQVNLIPAIEGMTQRMLAGAPAGSRREGETESSPSQSASRVIKTLPPAVASETSSGSAAPASHAAAPGETPSTPPLSSPKPGLKEGPIADASWVDLTHAVRQLRHEWDGETFEARFGPSPPLGVGSLPEPKEADPAGMARGETPRESDAPARAPATPQAPRPPEKIAAQARPNPPEKPITIETLGQALLGAEGAGPSPAAEKEDLVQKLDELIRLVRNSLDGREPAGPAVVPQKISREIAREVAGQLRATISSCLPAQPAPAGAGTYPPASQPAGPGAPAAPKQPARIPLDDVASIIDQITGMGPK